MCLFTESLRLDSDSYFVLSNKSENHLPTYFFRGLARPKGWFLGIPMTQLKNDAALLPSDSTTAEWKEICSASSFPAEPMKHVYTTPFLLTCKLGLYNCGYCELILLPKRLHLMGLVELTLSSGHHVLALRAWL